MGPVEKALKDCRGFMGAMVDVENMNPEMIRDILVLAIEYMNEHPPDENVLVDDEWLRYSGFLNTRRDIMGHPILFHSRMLDVEFILHKGVLELWVDDLCISEFSTRGQVRRMLELMAL